MSRNNEPSVRIAIHLHFNEFYGAERKVATFLLGASTGDDINHSITVLARKIGVSEATIIRFCKKVGFSGFSKLKLRLAEELGASNSVSGHRLIDMPINADDTIATIPQKIIMGATNSLQDMGNTLSPDMLEAAINAFVRARRVALFGVSNSAVVCRDLQCKLLRLGIICETYDDSHQQIIAACRLTAEDVAVAISHSGLTVDTINAAQVAKQNGATVICLSNCLNTPLIDTSDIKLLTGTHETTFNSETMASRISQLAIIDMLYVGIILTDYDRYTQMLADINSAVEEKSYKRSLPV